CGKNAGSCGQMGLYGLTEGHDLVGDERGGRQQQHQSADQQKDGRQLPLDRPVAQRHGHRRCVLTISATRSSLELMVRFAASAASRLILSRMRLLSVTN